MKQGLEKTFQNEMRDSFKWIYSNHFWHKLRDIDSRFESQINKPPFDCFAIASGVPVCIELKAIDHLKGWNLKKDDRLPNQLNKLKQAHYSGAVARVLLLVRVKRGSHKYNFFVNFRYDELVGVEKIGRGEILCRPRIERIDFPALKLIDGKPKKKKVWDLPKIVNLPRLMPDIILSP